MEIDPQVGMQVSYHPSAWDRSGPGAMLAQTGVPLLGFIVAANSRRNVNLVVFDAAGKHHPRTSIALLQEIAPDAPAATGQAYATWPQPRYLTATEAVPA